MKTLAIISSLRKKNTYDVIRQIEKVHNEVSSSEYEYLFLKDCDIKTCLGCHLCLTKGEGVCPRKDDLGVIISKIESADAVILASPNHTMNVNWLMKNYIDRLSYLMHRPRFFNQRFMILITSGSYMGVGQAIKALSPITSGGKVISRLGVMNSPGMNESKIRKEEKKVRSAAKKFALAMERNYEFAVSFPNMMWFSVFKATSGENRGDYPADYEYYKDKHFFTDRELNVFQRNTIGMFTAFFKFLIRRGLV